MNLLGCFSSCPSLVFLSLCWFSCCCYVHFSPHILQGFLCCVHITFLQYHFILDCIFYYIFSPYFFSCLVGFFCSRGKGPPHNCALFLSVERKSVQALQSSLLLRQNFFGCQKWRHLSHNVGFSFFIHSQLDAFSSNYYMWVHDIFLKFQLNDW